MADLEVRVDRLEEKVSKLEISISASLGEIKQDLTEIKAYMEKEDESSNLKNEVIKKDVINNDKRITKIEENQSKFVWTFISMFIGLLAEAVTLFLKMK